MKNILAREHREVLHEFAWSNVLVAFDYDGTLAPIVDDPAKARMRPETGGLLLELTKLYPVIVISGRAQPDALEKMRGANVVEVVGNHGIEPWYAGNRHVDLVRRWLVEITAHLGQIKGVVIEDKIYSVAIHYRQSREKKKARAAILKVVADLGDVRVIGGKQVINVLPKDAPHKGIALERERERFHCDTAIYVGDDVTDEDVFALDQPGRLLTIRVGAKSTSAAMYCIANQRAVDKLLTVLIERRRDMAEQRRTAR
jgi:trehalose 6-phosphate phosphatase